VLRQVVLDALTGSCLAEPDSWCPPWAVRPHRGGAAPSGPSRWHLPDCGGRNRKGPSSCCGRGCRSSRTSRSWGDPWGSTVPAIRRGGFGTWRSASRLRRLAGATDER